MYSNLATVYVPSPFYGDRNTKIDRITIHHMAGNFTVETCGNIFQRKGRNASSNYGIGSDGRIACYVDEERRAKTSSNWKNDARAITIEVANNVCCGDWHVSDKAYDSLIKLLCDVCTRHNILPLVWNDDKQKRKSQADGSNMTVHRDFSATLCPGDYLFSRMRDIANEVNKQCGCNNIVSDENSEQFLVQIDTNVLNIRTSPGTAYAIKGVVRRNQVYTIVEVRKVGTIKWGRLKSGAGWICLKYTKPYERKE